MYKLKGFESEDEKSEKIKELKLAFEALPLQISVIKSLEIGININPAEEYDFSLTVTFNNMDELHTYAKHPEHNAVAKIIRPVVDKRACVDFEY
jgi:hypothetical protein